MDQDPKTAHEEILQWAAEFLKEAALEKQASRERSKKPRSVWKRFWEWWTDYGTSVSIIVTIISLAVGAFWTANQFFIQQRQQVEQQKREADFRRQSLVVQFASDLGDKSKRNAAAYALGVLAKEDAIPLLSSHLREAVKSDEDASFRDAITQAFITIGHSSLAPMLDINRRASDSEDAKQGDALILATQSVILHFMKTEPQYFVEQKIELSGVSFRKIDVGFRNLANLNLSKVRVADSNFCSADLRGVNLEGAVFSGSVELGSTNLEAANLDGASFSSGSKKIDRRSQSKPGHRGKCRF